MYKTILKPLLFALDPETAHHLALNVTSACSFSPLKEVVRKIYSFNDSSLETDCLGKHFKNPLGLAAGFDKEAVALHLLEAIGFGHIEIGTVTPLPQPGNDRPRIFRLPRDNALINRMGFPSKGMIEAEKRRLRYKGDLLIGANVGKNKATDLLNAASDYKKVAECLAAHVDWVTLNVSSPNTPGLRSLQAVDYLEEIILKVRESLPSGMPLLVKVSPDLELSDLDTVLELLLRLKVNGIVATNTTVSRDGIQEKIEEKGGLSGRPLFRRTYNTVQHIYKRTEGKLVIVGVGGVSEPADFVALLAAGATLVRGYTAFVYEGPGWPKKLLSGLSSTLASNGIKSVKNIVGNSEFLKETFPRYSKEL